jgi:lysophospholipase L1-like esterase
MDANDWQGFHQFYFNRDWPAEYLTNCEGAHPTIKGYKVIADELAAFVKYKGYA